LSGLIGFGEDVLESRLIRSIRVKKRAVIDRTCSFSYNVWPMVVLQRSELNRNRLIYFLTIILSVAALVASVMLYSQSTETVRTALILLGLIALAALLLSSIQLFSFPRRSQVLLVQSAEGMLIATNALHESFKLRFLRDILNENVTAMSDTERARWKHLEDDGYFPSLYIRDPKKLIILKLCTMIFDDVFAVDVTNRWEHHDSASTSDPTFAKGEMPRLKAWKGV
jgi:hypothetical protein